MKVIKGLVVGSTHNIVRILILGIDEQGQNSPSQEAPAQNRSTIGLSAAIACLPGV
jgi:hypothetical protein